MKKTILFFTACFFFAAIFAQETEMSKRLANIDWQEDSTEITTVKDIVKVQQEIAKQTALKAHNDKIWAHRGFFNIAWHKNYSISPIGTQIPQGNDLDYIETGVDSYNGGRVPEFKRKRYGGALQVGRVIKLHKPIANMVMFGLDYTGIDLNINYFSAENNNNSIYDYQKENNETQKKYSHWNADKLDVSYGMSFGPSITIAPFTHINGAWGLHYLKFSFYYHIGYEAKALLLLPDEKADINYPKNSNNKDIKEYNKPQLMIGHGLTQSWGINMVWKRIGIGYEHSWRNTMKYKTFDSNYEKYWYKFEGSTNRIYLTYKIGK